MKTDLGEHVFQTGVAINRARAAQLQAADGRRLFTVDTHWIDADTPRRDGLQQALCGGFVEPASFSTEPSCVACREAMQAVERWAC